MGQFFFSVCYLSPFGAPLCAQAEEIRSRSAVHEIHVAESLLQSQSEHFRRPFQKLLHSHCAVNTSFPLLNSTAFKFLNAFVFNITALSNSRSEIMMRAPALHSPSPLPMELAPPPTSCCPGCNIPFCTPSLSHCLLETGARRLKTHSFSWDFHLFAPSSLPLLDVNIS